MLKLEIASDAAKFIKTVGGKHAGQISIKIMDLLSNPRPHDSELLKGTKREHLRTDVGEYRIVYRVEGNVLVVPIVDRRNDDEVYKQVKRKGL